MQQWKKARRALRARPKSDSISSTSQPAASGTIRTGTANRVADVSRIDDGPRTRSIHGTRARRYSLAWGVHAGDGIPGGVSAAVELARAGSAVVIYPEGARRRGRERRPRTGAARTALAAGVPLVPAAIRGTEGWRQRRRWQVTFGAPVDLHDLAGLDENEAAHEATRRLWESIKYLEAGLAS